MSELHDTPLRPDELDTLRAQAPDVGLDEVEALRLDDDGAGRGLHPAWMLAIVAVAAIIGYILYDGVSGETYFYTADQAVAQGPKLRGQTVRVKGKVEEGSIVGAAGQLQRTFRITEHGKSLRVSYDKALPDTFKEGMEVVAQGRVGDDYTLVADEVLVKCPSRYEGQTPDALPPHASRTP